MSALGLGEIAALVTAACFSVAIQCFGAAGLRIGSVAVNHVRLLLAVGLLVAMHVAVVGTPWPSAIAPADLLLFAASGVVGLTLGDACYFRSLVLVGPATASLVMTTAPAIAALLALGALGERLSAHAVFGIAITVAGVALAVVGRTRTAPDAATRPHGSIALGLLLAFGGAVGQAGGLVLARPALARHSALSGTLVRMAAGAAMLWLFTALQSAAVRRRPRWWAVARQDRRALGLAAAGALAGPACGVWLSQYALQRVPVGVAATLTCVTPIFVMVEDVFLFGRRPTALACLGALVAIAGVALLAMAR